jgi:hypothetical protein
MHRVKTASTAVGADHPPINHLAATPTDRTLAADADATTGLERVAAADLIEADPESGRPVAYLA